MFTTKLPCVRVYKGRRSQASTQSKEWSKSWLAASSWPSSRTYETRGTGSTSSSSR